MSLAEIRLDPWRKAWAASVYGETNAIRCRKPKQVHFSDGDPVQSMPHYGGRRR